MSNVLDLTVMSYSASAFADSSDELIKNAEMQLIGQGIDFDSMVGIGNSGLLVLPILARHFGVPFFAARKPGILSHNSRQPRGDGKIGRKWILVDDVKVTGGTINYVTSTINFLSTTNYFSTEYKGTYLYEPMSKAPGEFLYPDDTKKSVQAVCVQGHTMYPSYGMYAKVVEMTELAGDTASANFVTDRVMQAYPRWDRLTVLAIARSII